MKDKRKIFDLEYPKQYMNVKLIKIYNNHLK